LYLEYQMSCSKYNSNDKVTGGSIAGMSGILEKY
jgi:hypothetical protein